MVPQRYSVKVKSCRTPEVPTISLESSVSPVAALRTLQTAPKRRSSGHAAKCAQLPPTGSVPLTHRDVEQGWELVIITRWHMERRQDLFLI